MINLIFLLSIGTFLAFEFHKLIKFSLFYRMSVISSFYGKNIMKRLNPEIIRLFAKIALVDIIYSILLIIGMFTINVNLFSSLIIISFLKVSSFKHYKNVYFRKSLLIFDSFLTILILTIIIVNLLFYNISDFLLLTNIYNSMF